VDKGVVARGCKVAAAAGDDDAAAAISDADEHLMPNCLSSRAQDISFLCRSGSDVTLTNTTLLNDKSRISTLVRAGHSAAKVQQKG
jgi:hypothetical protein